MNRVMDADSDMPIGACHAAKACVSETTPLTNRIGRHFARIKAAPAKPDANMVTRGELRLNALKCRENRPQDTSGP